MKRVWLNSWKGPDRPVGPLMGLVRHVKFCLDNMDHNGERAFLALRRKNTNGTVRILRTNNVDYIWTWTGGREGLYIVFIDALTKIYYAIKVGVKKDDYSFSGLIADFSDKKITISGSYDEKREYCPYIYKLGEDSYAEIGVINNMVAGTWDEWHYKWYTFDCAPPSGSFNADIEIWRPPPQGFRYAFGYDLDPTWYSMSQFTAYSRYSKWSRVIDQAKRVYYPLTSTVKIDDVVLTVVQSIKVMNYYGKNNFTLDADGKTLTYGSSAKIDKIVTVDVPVDMQPALYFWPWIPYLDDIGHFDIFTYAERTSFGMSEGFFITPELDSFKSWEVKYYNKDGSDYVVGNYPDSGTFSEMPWSGDTAEESDSPPCEGWGGTWECGLLEYNQTKTSIAPYSSHGKRVIPIGVTGLDILRMETEWTQSGNINTMTNYHTVTEGNYPYIYEMRPEYVYGKTYYHDLFGPYVFKNVVDSTVDKTENYSNTMSLTQNLYIGNDVIFSGGGSLTYEAESTEHQKRDAEIYLKLTPKYCECDATLNYTTLHMEDDEEQTLIYTTSCVFPLESPEYTWQLSGPGTLTPNGTSAIYKAPNPIGCVVPEDEVATVSILCKGETADSCAITLHHNNTDGGVAYAIYSRGTIWGCRSIGWTGCQERVFISVRYVYCNGGSVASGTVRYYDSKVPCTCGGAWPEGIPLLGGYYEYGRTPVYNDGLNVVFDRRSQAMKDAGCCPDFYEHLFPYAEPYFQTPCVGCGL